MGEFAPDLGVQLALEIVISIEIQRVDKWRKDLTPCGCEKFVSVSQEGGRESRKREDCGLRQAMM